MADVFISYAREDRARAEQVARGLQGFGLDVFWDSEIPPGQTWADYVEEKLSGCKAVVVLWSQNSTKSQWVREEARMGRDKGRLIPAMIDASQAPFGFGEVQAADLSSWSGQGDHPEWRRFSDAVRRAAGGPAPSAAPSAPLRAAAPAWSSPSAASAPAAGKKGGVHPLVWIGGGALGAVVLLIAIAANMPDDDDGLTPVTNDAAQVQTAMGTPAPAAPETQAAPGGSPEQVVMAQLAQAEQAFAQQGYQQLGAPVSGGLSQGEQWNWPVTLQAGLDYRIIGVCDRDCGDLDLTLYDQGGNVVSQDTSADDHPVVASQPAWNGPFTVQVTMYNCTVAPCYYALVLYARPIG